MADGGGSQMTLLFHNCTGGRLWTELFNSQLSHRFTCKVAYFITNSKNILQSVIKINPKLRFIKCMLLCYYVTCNYFYLNSPIVLRDLMQLQQKINTANFGI